jgi:DNA-binding SARP family transcriptional activator
MGAVRPPVFSIPDWEIRPLPAYPSHAQSRAVRVQLLGDFRLFDGAVPIQIRQGGQRVLAFLGVHQRPMPRSRIAGTLWPTSATVQASANLRAALARLPRPGGRILTTSNTTELGLSEDVEVDIRVCEAQIRELRTTSTRLPGDATPSRITDDALSLLDQDVLPLWDDDWIMVERERHRQSRLHALEALSSSLRKAGRFAEALQAALAAVAGEALRESAHRRVIEVHLAEHNPGEALRQYEIYRRLLHHELGLRPSERIRYLVQSLLGRPGDAASATGLPR